MERTPIHERVRGYILEQSISQKQIAENMHVSEAKLSLMLNGKRRMTVDDYISICKAISVSPNRFIN